MVKVLLIRPGSTEYDQQGRMQGCLDVPLSEEGSIEVGRVVEELRDYEIDAIYSSPCRSAVATAEAIAAATGAKCKAIDDISNVDLGLWQGMLAKEVKRTQPKVYKKWQEHPDAVCPPEGEMLEAARKRMEAAVGKLLKKRKRGIIGLVVAEPLATLAKAYLCQSTPENVWKAAEGCASWELIDIQPAALVSAK